MGYIMASQTTTITLTSAPDPSISGEPTTLTAKVSSTAGSFPTGTVAFFDDGTGIGTAPLEAGAASFTTSALAAGSHALTAAYGGDADFSASVSPVDMQSVTPPANARWLRRLGELLVALGEFLISL